MFLRLPVINLHDEISKSLYRLNATTYVLNDLDNVIFFTVAMIIYDVKGVKVSKFSPVEEKIATQYGHSNFENMLIILQIEHNFLSLEQLTFNNACRD